MMLSRTALIVIAAITLSLQGCDLLSKQASNYPSTNPSPNSTNVGSVSLPTPNPVKTVDDGSFKKILDVAVPLPSLITFVETEEKQGDATILKVTKGGKTKDGYLALRDSDISVWNVDQTMEYYTITKKDGKQYILSVPKFK
jgi:hypothetical protein